MAYNPNVNKTIRDAIREAMKRKGLTQQALAEQAGVTQGMVAQYLNGHRGKPADSFQAILDVLELELKVESKK